MIHRWLPPLIWAIIIFIGSSIPGSQIPGQVSIANKILHGIEYAVLGWLTARTLSRHQPPLTRGLLYAIALAVCVLYGMTDEIHQALVPGRSADYADLIADTIGGACGIGLQLIWRDKRNIV